MCNCGEASWFWCLKDDRPKGEKRESEMTVGGPWLSGSGRAKAKDPEGTTTVFLKNPKCWAADHLA